VKFSEFTKCDFVFSCITYYLPESGCNMLLNGVMVLLALPF